MPLVGTYTKKSNPNIRITITETAGNFVVAETGTARGGCSGSLASKVHAPAVLRDDDYIALGALIIDTMMANPKGSGIGAILVYEYAAFARRNGRLFLGIYLVAGSVPTDPSPRAFYYKMGFADTLTTAQMKSEATFQRMTDEQQTKLLVSLPMSGASVAVASAAAQSWGKGWNRA